MASAQLFAAGVPSLGAAFAFPKLKFAALVPKLCREPDSSIKITMQARGCL